MKMMFKWLQVLLILSIINTNIFTQTEYYQPLIEPGKTWYMSNYSRYYLDGRQKEVLKIAKDTLLSGDSYYSLYKKTVDEADYKLHACIRETSEKRVEIFNDADRSHWYDFSLHVGDTFMFDREVVHIDTAYLPNTKYPVRKYWLSKTCINDTIIWIEGVGCLNGLFYRETVTCLSDTLIVRSTGGTINSVLDSVYINDRVLFRNGGGE